jgi:hypothetical protein
MDPIHAVRLRSGRHQPSLRRGDMPRGRSAHGLTGLAECKPTIQAGPAATAGITARR